MLNNCTFQGRFAADPEMRTTQSGLTVASFRMAVDRDNVGQDGRRATDWLNFVAWRKTAEFVCQYFRKGSTALVECQCQTRSYEDKNGQKRTATEFVVQKIHFCGPKTEQRVGIKINSVISVTFVIGSLLAGVASILYFSNYGQVSPMIGAMPGLKAFVAAVFGGIGSIPGAVIGAFIIGICESLIKSNADMAVFSNAFTFALLIVILLCKPNGLFGEKLTEKV